MKVRKTTWVKCENCPAAIALAMIEAKVPGDARIIEMEAGKTYENASSSWLGMYSAVQVQTVKFLFEWYREEDRSGTVVPTYERKFIL